MSEDKRHPADDPGQRETASEGAEFRKGAHFLAQTASDSYEPPSGELWDADAAPPSGGEEDPA